MLLVWACGGWCSDWQLMLMEGANFVAVSCLSLGRAWGRVLLVGPAGLVLL